MKRIAKQILIVAVVLLVILGIFFGLKWLLRTKPTCFDKIQNGEEEGVDCGGVCEVSCPTLKPQSKHLITKSVQISEGGGKCDVVAIVDNPNTSLGAEHVPYDLKWGTIDKKGEFYIYPDEERYVAEMNLPCQQGMSPSMNVGEPPQWQFLKADYRKPDLEISNSKFNYPQDNSYEFAEVSGMITNLSPFDLKEVEIYAVIKDSSGTVIAINKTTVNSLLVNQRREFRIFWTHQFAKSGTGSFYITSNLFNSDNFLKAYSAESSKWNVDQGNNFNYGDQTNENSK